MRKNHNPAFVLGNGRSRLAIDSKNLKDFGKVYGCNAIYREFNPDYLISVDAKMVNEIVESRYHESHEVWTNQNRGILRKDMLNFFSVHKGWSSGPTALWFACSNGHKTIYILGFDFHGIDGRFNNVYADSHNYKKSTEPATYYGNWVNQTVNVIQEHPHIKFIRVVGDNVYEPENFQTLPHISTISYEQFCTEYPNLTQK